MEGAAARGSFLRAASMAAVPSAAIRPPHHHCSCSCSTATKKQNSLRRTVSLILPLAALAALADKRLPPASAGEREQQEAKKGSGGGGLMGAITEMLDPNETTKSGRVLPKAYLKAARGVVKALRESLEADAADAAAFRRGADAAKESIREYLGAWRGQRAVASEESYAAVERALRALGSFYSKAGPDAAMPKDVKASILSELSAAEADL